MGLWQTIPDDISSRMAEFMKKLISDIYEADDDGLLYVETEEEKRIRIIYPENF